MKILGLTTMGASAACIMIDGVLIAAVEEERLTRVKNEGGFPINAIIEVLSIAGLKISEIDIIAIYWKPYVLFPRIVNLTKKILKNPNSIKNYIEPVSRMLFNRKNIDNKREEENGSWSELFRVRSLIKRKIGFTKAKIKFFDHHLTHQVYAEMMRDWDEYISMSYDGGGEKYSTQIVHVKNGARLAQESYNWPNSLGHFYSYFTGFLGFKMLEGEYKMMGLAPYGKPLYVDELEKYILKVNKSLGYELNTKLCDYHSALKGEFNPEIENLFCKKRHPNSSPNEDHLNLAHSVQLVFERALKSLLMSFKEKYNITTDNIIISGGCALNVSANGILLTEKIFNKIMIPPAPHDSGCAIGASILAAGTIQIDKNSLRNPYLGRTFTSEEIKILLKDRNIDFVEVEDDIEYCKQIAGLISENKIVAWFQGASEFGPRALGNRSYLANPKTDQIRDIINEKIKKRELFRPFAPSVLEHRSKEYFYMNQDSPYMNIVAKVKESKIQEIPAVTHIDGTARVHTVNKMNNPKYFELISAFEKITKTPVLLNTSFNIQEPIVYSPSNAIDTFINSGVDILAIESLIIKR
jgi:carbamoyltransferase